MQTEIKVRLSLFVQGAQRFSSQECDENPKQCLTYETVKLEWYNKKHKKKTETLQLALSKNKLIKQVINISKESYNYMISKDSIPTLPSLTKKYPVKVWLRMSKKERLEVHLGLTADSLGAKGFTYEILED